MKKTAFIFSFLFVFALGYSQENFPKIDDKDLPKGSKISRTDFFEPQQLYGYNSNYAEIYIEYGLNKLLVQDIFIHQKHYKIEIYQMKSKESAYGVYSLLNGRGKYLDTLSKFNNYNKEQVQVAQANYVFFVMNDKGTKVELDTCLFLTKLILNKIKEPAYEFPVLFKINCLKNLTEKLRYFVGKAGLQAGFPRWNLVFEKDRKNIIYLMYNEEIKGYILLTKISFGNKYDVPTFFDKMEMSYLSDKFLQQSGSGETQAIWQISDSEIIYLQTSLPESTVKTIIEQINEVIPK